MVAFYIGMYLITLFFALVGGSALGVFFAATLMRRDVYHERSRAESAINAMLAVKGLPPVIPQGVEPTIEEQASQFGELFHDEEG